MSAVKMAIFSDIHDNLTALNAVLDDIEERGGVDQYWVLGDLVALGPEPVAVLERLNRLENIQFCRGNTDRYVFAGDRPPPTLDETRVDLSLLPVLVDVAKTFAWTQGMVTQAGWLEWLRELPFELRQTLPDGTRLLGLHATPEADDMPIHPNLPEEAIADHLCGCQADLICMGHTHLPMDIQAGRFRAVNPGSLSNPPTADLQAGYIVLTADSSGYSLEQRRLDYDYQAVLDALEKVQHPGRDWIIRHFTKG